MRKQTQISQIRHDLPNRQLGDKTIQNYVLFDNIVVIKE